jgi:hypothetical protein
MGVISLGFDGELDETSPLVDLRLGRASRARMRV